MGIWQPLGLQVMIDDKGVQPVYEPAPLIRGSVLEQYPEIADIINPVFASLDLEGLQRMNAAVAVDGGQPEAIAREYLVQNGFLQ